MTAYLYLIAAMLWALSLGAVGVWQNGAGHDAERVLWKDREVEELRLANAEIERLHADALAAEHRHAKNIADISVGYQKEINNARVQRDREVAAARSGALVLRFGAAASEAGPGLRTATCSGSGGRDGSAPGELPRAIAADLLDIVGDADDVARQLAACQRVVDEDRRLCGIHP